MSVKDKLLSYYKNEPIMNAIANANDAELSDLKKFLSETYPVYIQTDFMTAYKNQTDNNRDLHNDIEKRYGIQIPITSTPELLYASLLLSNICNMLLSVDNLKTFITRYITVLGNDGTKWILDEDDLRINRNITIKVDDLSDNISIQINYLKAFLSRVAPADLVVNIYKIAVKWQNYEDRSAKWEHFEAFTWNNMQNELIS
jgi:hypothetical protein